MSIKLAKPEHEIAYQDLCALANKHAGNLSAIELLAVAANMLGKLVAMQDQRTTTADEAMEVVAKNLEHGNAQVLEQLSRSAGRA